MVPMEGGITIGELATRCDVSRDTVRFYEREKLLPRPKRSPSKYRLYGEPDVDRVLFIRRGQQIGLTLDDLRELLRIHELETPGECRQVAKKLEFRIAAIDEKLAAFRKFRRLLAENLEHCRRADSDCCPVTIDLASSPRKRK